MNEVIAQIQNAFQNDPIIPIVSAVAVVLLTILLFFLFRRSPTKRKYLILLGNSYSGKTAIFTQLVYKKPIPTQISIKENKGVITLDKTNKKLECIDIPGFGNIRYQLLNKYKIQTKAIVFVVDSSTFSKDCKDVALFLFDILSDPALAKAGIPILIACNKQDYDFSKSSVLIKSNLEKEIDVLRKTSQAKLVSTDDKSKETSRNNLLSTKSNKSFDFNDLKTFKVDFCECSAVDNEKSINIDALKAWLEKKYQ